MIASSGEEIDFGSTRFLQAVQQPVYLVNNGSNELNIDSIYVEANVGFLSEATIFTKSQFVPIAEAILL